MARAFYRPRGAIIKGRADGGARRRPRPAMAEEARVPAVGFDRIHLRSPDSQRNGAPVIELPRRG